MNLRSTSLFLRFRTNSSAVGGANAVLFATFGDVDYVKVSLTNNVAGSVQVEFDLGRAPVTLTSPTLVTDGRWHSLLITLNNGVMVLSLDSQHAINATSPSTFTVLNIFQGTYLGNTRPSQRTTATSFVGQFSAAVFNGVDLLGLALSADTSVTLM